MTASSPPYVFWALKAFYAKAPAPEPDCYDSGFLVTHTERKRSMKAECSFLTIVL